MRETAAGLKYGFFVIFHPFRGFWNMKREGMGNARSASILLFLTVLATVLKKIYTGYFFSVYKAEDFNILLEIAIVFCPFFLWCAANWCLTTLADGEGSFKDIYIMTAYALMPYILIQLGLTVISNVMCLEELAYYSFFNSLSVIWSGALIFFGSMTIHQYSLKKNILVTALIILGMGTLIFIGMLFYNLVSQIAAFFMGIYTEINFRI